MLRFFSESYNSAYILGDDFVMGIGIKIKTLRKQHGWTQKEFAKKLGFVQPHVNRWETSKVFPSLEALKKISELFDISIDTLVFDEKDLKKLTIKDRSLLSKLNYLEKLSPEDRQMIVRFIESLASKNLPGSQ